MGGQTFNFDIGPNTAVVYGRSIDSAGVHSFYAIPVSGAKPRLVARLDDSPGRAARIIFSVGPKDLYFTLTQAESDIWVVELRR